MDDLDKRIADALGNDWATADILAFGQKVGRVLDSTGPLVEAVMRFVDSHRTEGHPPCQCDLCQQGTAAVEGYAAAFDGPKG